MKNNLVEVLRNEIIEQIGEYEGTYTCDLMNEMYNNDYYIIGTYQAKQFLKENIDELFETLERYNDEIGEQYPHITDPEKLATLVALYKAEEIFNNLKSVTEIWNNELIEENISDIIDELKTL